MRGRYRVAAQHVWSTIVPAGGYVTAYRNENHEPAVIASKNQQATHTARWHIIVDNVVVGTAATLDAAHEVALVFHKTSKKHTIPEEPTGTKFWFVFCDTELESANHKARHLKRVYTEQEGFDLLNDLTMKNPSHKFYLMQSVAEAKVCDIVVKEH